MSVDATEWIRRQREERRRQGLTETITDPEVLRLIAALLAGKGDG